MKLDQQAFEHLLRTECGTAPLTLASFPGNAGDHLITMSSLNALQAMGLNVHLALPHTRLDDRIADRTLLIAGGGNLVPLYDDVSRLIERVRGVCRRLIVLPHTIGGHEPLLKTLSDSTLIFCREQPSFDYVRKTTPAQTYLCDDMVFYGDMAAFRQPNLPLHWLKEIACAARIKTISRKKYILAKLRLLQAWRQARRNSSRPQVGHFFRTDKESAGQALPGDNCDVSVVFNYGDASIELIRESARDFVNFIDQFDEVHTDRLHVCIAAARLGKQVHFSGGSYHKCRSVYENSIVGRFDNVIWT